MRDLNPPKSAVSAVRHPDGRVRVELARKELAALVVPSIGPGGLAELEVTMSPKAALDLWQALTQLIDADAELRVAAGREDPEAVLFTQTNGLEES